jgi:hypothetical protein
VGTRHVSCCVNTRGQHALICPWDVPDLYGRGVICGDLAQFVSSGFVREGFGEGSRRRDEMFSIAILLALPVRAAPTESVYGLRVSGRSGAIRLNSLQETGPMVCMGLAQFCTCIKKLLKATHRAPCKRECKMPILGLPRVWEIPIIGCVRQP